MGGETMLIKRREDEGVTLAEAIADIEAETALDIELKALDNGWPI